MPVSAGEPKERPPSPPQKLLPGVWRLALRLQIAQSRYDLQTLDPNVGIIYILGAHRVGEGGVKV